MTELLSQDVLRSQITAINGGLQTLAEKAKSQFRPFDESSIPNNSPDEVGTAQLEDPANFAGFWNHCIAGNIANARTNIERAELKGESVNEDLIRVVQARTIRYTRIRLAALFIGSTAHEVDLASCEAYLKVARAFPWSDPEAGKQGLFGDLNKSVIDLAHNYMMLSGKRPL